MMSGNDSQGRPADAAHRLGRDVNELVREELHAVWGQITTATARGGVGLALLGGAGACAALAGQSAWLVLVRVLEKRVPRPLAAAVLAASFGGAASVLTTLGARQLQRARQDTSQVTADVAEGITEH